MSIPCKIFNVKFEIDKKIKLFLRKVRTNFRTIFADEDLEK